MIVVIKQKFDIRSSKDRPCKRSMKQSFYFYQKDQLTNNVGLLYL